MNYPRYHPSCASCPACTSHFQIPTNPRPLTLSLRRSLPGRCLSVLSSRVMPVLVCRRFPPFPGSLQTKLEHSRPCHCFLCGLFYCCNLVYALRLNLSTIILRPFIVLFSQVIAVFFLCRLKTRTPQHRHRLCIVRMNPLRHYGF